MLLPAGDEQGPVGNQHPQQFSITLTLLAVRVGRTGVEHLPLGLPELKEEFNLPAGAGEDVCLSKAQVGDIAQVDRPGGEVALPLGKGTLVKACCPLPTKTAMCSGSLPVRRVFKSSGCPSGVDRCVPTL